VRETEGRERREGDLCGLVVADGSPELFPLSNVFEADVHRCVSRAQRAGGDVESATQDQESQEEGERDRERESQEGERGGRED
jgi:hypothetical protein